MSELSRDQLLDVVATLRQEQRRRWKSGERVEVEELLAGHRDLVLDETGILDLVYNEICLRDQLGKRPTLEEYQRRFPPLTTKLALLFEAHAALVNLQSHTDRTAVASPDRIPIVLPRSAEDLLDRFETAWQGGGTPCIEDFSGEQSYDESVRRRLSLELVAIDMEYRWRLGRTVGGGDLEVVGESRPGPLLEEYLTRFPELGPPDRPSAELVVEEYRIRRRYAESPDPREYKARFPSYGEDILELLSPLEKSTFQLVLPENGEDSRDTSREVSSDTVAHSLPSTEIAGHDSDAPLPYSDFRFEHKIGAGGMGTVYRAMQVSLGKLVAVKVLQSVHVTCPRAVERFLREGRSVARLRHPHIVGIHGIGRTPDGGYFMVMDLVEGENLEKIIRANSLSISDVFLVVVIAKAIHHAHAQGVIHRDLKPSNVLVDEDGQVRVSDFGLAKLIRSEDPGISVDNEILGTPSYMAPEQASPKWGKVDRRTDVYGLGGILYAVLTCQPPYNGQSYAEVLAKVISDELPVAPSQFRPEIPKELDQICLRCLSKQPADRFETAGEVAEALTNWVWSIGLESHQERIQSGQVRLAQLVSGETGSKEIWSTPFDPSRSSGPPRGAMPLDCLFYVERTTDREFETALTRCDSIILIRGARQMGKTSLLARGVMQARRSGCRVVLTDFQKLRAEDLHTPDRLFLTISELMADELELDAYPADLWDSRRSANVNFERFLRKEILSKSDSQLVWALDEVDRLMECPFRSEVFGLFRSWHNARALQPTGPWSRLTLAMAYATEAQLFIDDPNQSPFNVGTLIAMTDFSREQIATLNARYGSPLHDDVELARFEAIVGGHPYLVSRGLYEMARSSLKIDDFEAQVEQDIGFFSDHLQRLLTLLHRDTALLEAFRGLLNGEACKSVNSFYSLRSAGIISGDCASRARPRCQLYASYFKRHTS